MVDAMVTGILRKVEPYMIPILVHRVIVPLK